MNNHVVIKGRLDRLEIRMNPDIDFLEIKEIFKEKIISMKNFLKDSKMALEFSGRKLSPEEENELIEIVIENTNVVINYVLSEKNSDIVPNKSGILKPISEEGETLFHKGTLRSGSKIEYNGNIVIIGDVNPGAIIKSRGNVLVIGHLNGSVYAGLGGDKNSFIAAMFLNPIQLGIADVEMDNVDKKILDTNRVNKNDKFKFAHLENGEIIIGEWI